MNNVIVIEVDDRKLLLALDNLYRTHMKVFETECLLPYSRDLMNQLSLQAQNFPIEGYYVESDALKEYFLNIRTLQKRSNVDAKPVRNSEPYQALLKVLSSEIYGSKLLQSEGFFPERLNSLYFALDTTEPNDWTVEALTDKAYQFSVADNDISLVGLAAFIQDAVVLAALRESVVLYSAIAAGSPLEPPTYKYVWNVSEELQNRANQFIQLFDQLTSSPIRQACAENAEYFNNAYEDNEILGRCVFIGFDDSKIPNAYYHWAINYEAQGGNLVVDAFWDTKIWTTEYYQNHKRYGVAGKT
jgi:hypothetical protein